MKKNKFLVYGSLFVFAIAIGVFVYVVNISKALSYLSSDPKACINCHVMNTEYATWQHSSHAQRANCVDCHLPRDNMLNKYLAKARDGYNHTVAFTLRTYANAIQISDDGAKRVQENCISCHQSVASTLQSNGDLNHQFDDPSVATGRRCWECHTSVPHGTVRGLAATPNALGVKEVK